MFAEAPVRRRFSLSPISWFVFLAIVVGPRIAAQARLDVFVTPIPNAPFSGVVNVQRSIVQRDGSIATLNTARHVARDTRGRIYSEATTLLPASSIEAPEVISVHLYDPETRVSTMLFPRQRTFSTSTVDRPPATSPPGFLDASPAGANLPQNNFTKVEDLSFAQVEGLPSHGIREVQTIPADNNGKQILISDEYWYSDDLRINLVLRHSDPRTGTVTLTVTQIKRAEPEPTLFEIPNNYTRVGRGR
jgi:hypothetical protein